ncbi:MAG: TraB/GumN family protein, partial [Myxococcales bacterium]|nr:TraB/GumN family protein [Myxococcales bacterium]
LAALLALGGSGCASSAKPASGSAAGPGKSAAAGAARATSPRPLEDGPGPMLWRVTSPRGTSALLLGTMHLGIEAKRDLPAFVFKAFNAAKQVAFEADVRTINPIELIKLARLRGPPTLDKRLGPEAWAKLTKLLAGKLPPVVMAQLEPWLIVVMLVAKVVPRTTPMDLALMKDAMVNKQRLVFLEHWKEQLGMMDKVIKAEHLAKLLDHTAEQRTLFNKMATLYRAGQAKQMRALLDEEPDWSRGDADKAHELMLLRRNQRWLPKVRRMIGDNDAFIAVGLAHLIGKDNLLDMLRARGYKVARVRR